MTNLFKKSRAAASNYVGSVSGDANQIKNTLTSKFGSVDSISNMFDQRIADGLTDLLSGATGIRTTNIPEISAETLQTREANREARAQALNSGGRTNLYGDPVKQITYKYPEKFVTESDENQGMQNYIHFRSLMRRNNDGNEQLFDIFLYIPTELTDGTAVEYEGGDKGFIGGLVAKFMGRGQGGTDQGLMSGMGQMVKDAAGGAVGKSATGTVLNPMNFQIFKGVSKRDFTYSFELYPESHHDSTLIRKICYAFKKSSLPGLVPETGNKIYTFPNEWAIRFHGPIKNWVDYPMVSVLTKVDVDYNLAGNARYYDGAPLGVKLSLSFSEVFQLDRIKYDERVSALMNIDNQRREASQEGGSYADVMGLVDPDKQIPSDVGFLDRTAQGSHDALRESKLGTNSLYQMEKKNLVDDSEFRS